MLINKPLGLTPLQAIYSFKEKYPEYRDATIGYAGRLDPMAEGLLLLLINDENKKKKEYESLPKTYVFSMLLGISTDSYDLMGKITKTDFNFDSKTVLERLKHTLPEFIGEKNQAYPPYSSRTVNGKPLYWHALRNRLDEIIIPTKLVNMSSFDFLSSSLLTKQALFDYINAIVSKVRGEFRQDEILKIWEDNSSSLPFSLDLVNLKINCSSGTYVRGLVHEMGVKLGIPAVTYSIKRTRIGNYLLEDAE